ncbi:hypothetical protein [Parathalassolituus penaei]|uniref:Uncharacterized protein n=1 Tax=Parathalassolituus penaei TaxID=2997323 RepID=A0A9X3ELT5_9GAMM|nr:hypothetical protein [Parathalassolituus penaei]MCY0966721.1 hypothetical protein [Parathalassolituus penaei]
MAFRPDPWIIYCPDCGWRRICAPKSDTIMAWENPAQCWHCHGDNLQRGPLTVKDRIALVWRQLRG